MRTIRFVIDQQGKVTSEVEGVVGESCVQLTAPFEKALGVKVSQALKDEYYQKELGTQWQSN